MRLFCPIPSFYLSDFDCLYLAGRTLGCRISVIVPYIVCQNPFFSSISESNLENLSSLASLYVPKM